MREMLLGTAASCALAVAAASAKAGEGRWTTRQLASIESVPTCVPPVSNLGAETALMIEYFQNDRSHLFVQVFDRGGSDQQNGSAAVRFRVDGQPPWPAGCPVVGSKNRIEQSTGRPH